MQKELAKNYDPKDIEDRLYEKWMEKKYFHAEVDGTKKPFTIVIPPPNITGQLHMGHALDNTMQDILIRFKRMQGYNALWQPGTDHASIATEVKIIEKMREEGITKEDIGREKFLMRAWEWKKEYGGRIVSQLKKLGSSCDWDRERFTMDEGCSEAVEEVFINLYKKGLIYKGSRIINWCPVCATSISDAEVEYKEQEGHFWHIKYPVEGTDEFIEIATTRPETMLGDTAVAVHPEDERYKKFVGMTVRLPLTGREIPIIADGYVDMEFGTGAVKITPAHDPNDFEVGKRHNLPEINIMSDDALINQNGGKFAGLDRYVARKQIVNELEMMGLLVKTEEHIHNVGTHDRCGATIEPLIKKQWFVKMEEMIKPAVEAVKNKDIKLVPERMEKIYFNWTDNIKDWCISRQLWWGHRIPVYYCSCGEVVAARANDSIELCSKCGGHLVQDEDTLDTWFSSALWPFSTLGWPKKTKDLEYFYPTDVLVTGYDIIFFWVIRMIFSGFEQMKEKPFHTVFFHGLIRDSKGRKMSKSLGNGIDPLEVIDKYGADALRFTLVTGNAPGNDMRFYWERVEASRNFANKVWNASRFIMMNMNKMREDGLNPSVEVMSNGTDVSQLIAGDTSVPQSIDKDTLTDADMWILSKANTLVGEVTESLDKYELGIAAQKIYDFIWEEFCDWYIEMVKPRLYGEDSVTKLSAIWTLRTVLKKALKLLHPYMPFVTEEIYCTLTEMEGETHKDESIMVSQWPLYDDSMNYRKQEAAVELMKEAVKAVRYIRTEMNAAPSRKINIYVVSENVEVREIFEGSRSFFMTLSGALELIIQADKDGIGNDAVSKVISQAVIYIPFADLVDVSKELERLSKELKRLEGEIERGNKMLSNASFMEKAPEAKVLEERGKLSRYSDMLLKVKEQIRVMESYTS